jgi:signal transduction histidine kinase/ligand-binding sensor domain-containing protein
LLKKESYLLLAFFSTLFGATLSARENSFSFQNLTMEDGLSSNRITTIFQDKDGFIWIGTEDGLNRFDGHTFKVYRNSRANKNSLSHNYVWSLDEDEHGSLWIGTSNGGLNKFDPVHERFTHYRHNPEDSTSLGHDIVQHVYVDKNDNIWVGTWGGGLNLFHPETGSFTRYNHDPGKPESIGSNKIWCIYEDSRDNFWVGTVDGGLNLFDRDHQSFRHFLPDGSPDSFGGRSAVTLCEDSNGNLWVGTHGDGLDRYDYETGTFTHFKANGAEGTLSGDYLFRIIEDNQRLLWIATRSGGLHIYDQKSNIFSSVLLDPYNSENRSTSIARPLFEDSNGVLWIGTFVDGIYKVDRKPSKFSTINKSNGLPEDFVFSICQDRLGEIWIGNYTNLTRYNPADGKFTTYPLNESGHKAVAGRRVRYIFEDSSGELWIGTYFGKLNRYDRETDSFIKYDLDFQKNNPDLNNVRVIFEDSEGMLWFGINAEGLIKYDPKTDQYELFDTKTESESRISDDAVLCIVEDSERNLWIGTFGKGLNKFDKKNRSFTHYFSSEDDAASLSDNSIIELLIDSRGDLWVGTFSGGLCKYDSRQNNFITYREEDGLAGNFVCGILEDEKNNLWISTSKGISRFNLATNIFKNYDFTLGVQKGEFMPAARLKAKNNRLYFGGVNGITHFHPDSLSSNSLIPPIVITSFKIHNSEARLAKNIAHTDTVFLHYNEDNFSFEFAALDYTFPERNQYAYMLEGLDENWNYADNRRFANYTHLDPGEYVFRVKGSNNEGTWNEAGAAVVIVIEPPFWETWWFRGVSFLSFIGAAGFMYRKRISNLKKEKRAQEEFSKRLIQSQEEERKRIASELHDSLGQNLLIIKNQAAMGMKSEDQGIRHEQLAEISSNASLAIDEVRRIAYNLHPHQLDRLGLTKALKSILTKIESLSEIHFSDFIENIDGIFIKEHEISIYRIVQECINNIIKHSGATTAEIRITMRDKELIIRISDNGQGFEVGKDASNQRGFGMKNLSERIRILEGRLEIRSGIDQGTTISVQIPIKKDEAETDV